MIAPRPLFRTVDDRIVDVGDPAAAFLVVGADCDVPAEYADAVQAHLAKRTEKPKPAEPAATVAASTPKPRGSAKK